MHISLVHTFTHTQQVGAENVPWCITDLNKDFSLCETYPTVLGVPVSTSEDDLRTVAQFRSKGRIPVSQKNLKKKILPEYFMLKMCIVPCNQKNFCWPKLLPSPATFVLQKYYSSFHPWSKGHPIGSVYSLQQDKKIHRI